MRMMKNTSKRWKMRNKPTVETCLDKVEIALPRDGDGFEYHLVLNDHPTEDEYKEGQ
jgi:hypothetical protein